MTRARFFLLTMLAVVLTGCVGSGSAVVKPDDLVQQGMVMGEISELSPLAASTHITIDGKSYKAGSNQIEGTRAFLVALPPGKHVLESLSTRSSGAIGSGMQLNSVLSYPLNIPFSVERGKVTDIGQVLIGRLGKEQKFAVGRVDSGDRAWRILQARFPDVAARVGQAGVRKEAVKWTSPKLIRKIKRYMAREYFFRMDPRYVSATEQWHYVGGPLGTLIRFKTHDENTKVRWKGIEAGTFADVSSCVSVERRGLCMVDDLGRKSLLVIDGLKVTHVPMPVNFDAVSRHITPKDTIFLASRHGEVRLTHDWGATWTTAALPAQEANWLDNRAQFFNGRGGVYFHYAGKTEGWYHAPYDSLVFQRVDMMKEMEGLNGVLDTPNGTYLGPAWSLASNSLLYFRPKGTNDWLRIDLPQGRCSGLGGVSGEPNGVAVLCGGVPPKPFVSLDQGKTWRLDERRRWPL